MTPRRDDDRLEADFPDVCEALERLARRLDAERYPGQAWPAAAERRPTGGRRATRWAAWGAAAARSAAAAVLAMVHHPQQQDFASRPAVVERIRPADVPAVEIAWEDGDDGESLFPEIFVLEDLDSYSIIDLSTGSPLISYARKDAFATVCVAPLPPAPSS